MRLVTLHVITKIIFIHLNKLTYVLIKSPTNKFNWYHFSNCPIRSSLPNYAGNWTADIRSTYIKVQLRHWSFFPIEFFLPNGSWHKIFLKFPLPHLYWDLNHRPIDLRGQCLDHYATLASEVEGC